MLSVDLYWSFRSPYSYLSVRRIVALQAEFEVDVRLRVVHPLAIRDPAFFDRSNPLLDNYVRMDARRVAASLSVPFAWPDPDPVVRDAETRKFADVQPYIYRLSRLGVEAARRERGLAFADKVSRLLWGSYLTGWHEGDHLAGAASRAGLMLRDLDQAISAADADHDAEIASNHMALHRAGHWGVPTLVFDGEPFFGQDRVELCIWRMHQRGLMKRH
jgi:2-hydroxychromene-2-carboxylate isomerase